MMMQTIWKFQTCIHSVCGHPIPMTKVEIFIKSRMTCKKQNFIYVSCEISAFRWFRHFQFYFDSFLFSFTLNSFCWQWCTSKAESITELLKAEVKWFQHLWLYLWRFDYFQIDSSIPCFDEFSVKFSIVRKHMTHSLLGQAAQKPKRSAKFTITQHCMATRSAEALHHAMKKLFIFNLCPTDTWINFEKNFDILKKRRSSKRSIHDGKFKWVFKNQAVFFSD